MLVSPSGGRLLQGGRWKIKTGFVAAVHMYFAVYVNREHCFTLVSYRIEI